jgi:putative ABC transport system permease protein
MLLLEIVRVALQSIRANLFRATLTMLGIIIGVGAVITMLAAGAGAQKRIDEQIAALGSNILSINASRFFARGIARNQLTLRIDDVAALRKDSAYLDAVVPEVQNRGQLKFNNKNDNVRLTGTTYEYANLFNYPLAAGRFFTAEEDSARRRVVVLGSDVPTDLETDAAHLLGKNISINNQPFEVIGVLSCPWH